MPTTQELLDALGLAADALRAIYVETGDRRCTEPYDRAFALIYRAELAAAAQRKFMS